VDIPRAGAGTCTIPGSGGVATQVVPAGNVYVAYSVFLGSGNNPHSKVLFTRSTDCGKTWANPTKINESYSVVSQSPAIAVNPVDGTVMVAWRQFGDPNLVDPGQILVAQSADMGQTFLKTAVVAGLGLANPPPPPSPQQPTYTSFAFDQPTLPAFGDPAPTARMFRSNGYPAICAGTDGVYRLAWAQRWTTTSSDSRIVVSTSTDGVTWSSPTPVDNYGGQGHQFMPAIACSASQATLVWYDQRYDNAPAVFGQLWFGMMIFDPIPPPPAHTIDVRVAQSDPTDPTGKTFLASAPVSRYQWALDTTPNPSGPGGINGVVQLEFNPVNWPLYAGGVMPFLGDYIDLAAARTFKPPIGTSTGWTYNADPNDARVLHAAWTDNRDIVKPNPTVDWTLWSPPGSAGCAPATVSNRNQNVYTSRLSSGLVVGVEGNSRIVAASGTTVAQRAFAVFVENSTTVTRHFHLVTGQPPGGAASFRSDVPLGDLLADIAPLSTIARTVFVPASQLSPVIVGVTEVDASGAVVAAGLTGSAVINSDGTAPPPIDGSVATVELHTPVISDPLVSSYANPLYQNPTFINPTFINPTFINPTFINPTFINPTFINPTFINPTFINPTFINPTFINQPLTTDVTWQVTNSGNVASGFNFGAILASVPTSASYQLIINRLYSTPGSTNCGLGQQFNANIQAVINNPVLRTATGGNPLAPDVTNATFALAAGDSALVTLRVVHDGSFNPSSVSAQTVSQAENSDKSSTTALSAPAIGVPIGGVKAEATGPAGAIVTFTVTAVDATNTPVPVACSPVSGAAFGIGTTPVTCTATDAAGKTSSANFNVAVVDTTPPVLGVPSAITAGATSAAGAVVTFATSASDLIDGALSVACVPASGSTFAIGTAAVSCTATDAHGNTGSANFSVTVRDQTAPVLTVPAAATAEAASAAGAAVTFSVSALDAVDGARPVACVPASGSLFALGTTPVSCSSVDSQGNTGSAGFTVTVRDTTPPALTLPAPITAEAAGLSGATVTFAASSVDLVDGARPVSCSPLSGSTFVIGTTTVVCSAADTRGNAGSASFTVTVRDTTPPTVTVPAPITAEATGPSGATVTFAASSVDLVDGARPVSCSPLSGSTFVIGTTTVVCSAADTRGNARSASFTVTVRDTTPPTVTVPAPITAEATSRAGAAVSFSATATDLVSGNVAVACTPASGSVFPIGTTTVACSASDASGNARAASFTITVRDTLAPSVTVAVNPNTLLWSPNKTMTPVTVTGTAIDATLTSVTYQVVDEYGYIQPSGSVSVSTNGSFSFVISLEAWRQGTDANGRVYTVTVTAIDASGRTTRKSTTVVVPHNS
jgi:hypothetical protein